MESFIIRALVRLPNGKIISFILSNHLEHNKVSQGVVDMLLQSEQIIIDEDHAFVEFEKPFISPIGHKFKYFDRAWADIVMTPALFIEVGRSWLQEWCVEYDREIHKCMLRPPHFKDHFYFADELHSTIALHAFVPIVP